MSSLWGSATRICGLLLVTFLQQVAADPSVPIVYCASINTASTAANTSIYQSDGLCHNFCSEYAYAIVQETDCWCSDYTPDSSTQVDTSECDTSCPGYPSDLCGGPNLYGYMAQSSNTPAGTKGAGSSSSSSTSSSSSHKTSTSASTTQSPTVQTVTTGGVVQTVTVTPTASSQESAGASSSQKGVSTGTAVGIAVGVVAGVIFAASMAAFLWYRRRQQRTEKDEALVSSGGFPSTGGTSPGTINGFSVAEAVGAASFSRRGEGSWDSDLSGRRRSVLMPIDPRIDPGFSDIYSRGENKSRDSVNSLRDDHDYSRRVHQPKVLRATNPDPDVD